MGVVIIILFFIEARKHNDSAFSLMWLAITLSFGLYIPVVLFSSILPIVGILMIPKTVAYVWIVLMCYFDLKKVRIAQQESRMFKVIKVNWRRNAMDRISNIDNIPKEYMYDPDFQSRLKTVLIGDSLGSEKIYVNIDYVKPGGVSTKYHSHSTQEEFFLIMSGKGILRINGEEIFIKTGDAVSKPAGKDITHQFINNSSEILQILDVGTREKDDVTTYPDEDVIFLRNKGLVFNMKDNIKNWTSDPNE